jgi:NAD(P)H-nitrite reductase large subunit
LEGVVVLDTLADAKGILKLARRARSAVVVGGGITALEIVEGLVSRGVKTHYFLRGDRYWSNVLDKTESRIVEGRLREEGVKIHYQTELAEIQGMRGKVTGVKTRDGEKIKCKLVPVAIGIHPRIELATAIGMKTDRGILVDEYLCTSIPDIYAAGDVAQVYDPHSGRSVVDSLWGPAREQGHAAGLNMAGDAVPYLKAVPFNVTRLAGLTTTIIGNVGRGSDVDLLGIARGDSETWRQLPEAIAAQSDFKVNRLRVMVGRQHILGAIVMGDQTLSQPLRHLVAKRADITPIRSHLLQPKVKLGDLLTDFWCQWSAQRG